MMSRHNCVGLASFVLLPPSMEISDTSTKSSADHDKLRLVRVRAQNDKIMSLLQNLGFQIKDAYPIAFRKCMVFIVWYHTVDSIGLICHNVHILKDPKSNSIA